VEKDLQRAGGQTLRVSEFLVIIRKTISFSLAFAGLVCAAAAQNVLPTPPTPVRAATTGEAPDFSATVIPITDLKPTVRPSFSLFPDVGFQAGFGTGFCVDPACRYIGTDYHVAAMERPRKIKGDLVTQLYLATGPKDDGATMHLIEGGTPIFYNVRRDLAIFELQRPLRHHHALPFSLVEPQVGQKADIYAYPLERLGRPRRLLRYSAVFRGKTPAGLLVFEYKLSNGKDIAGGASGGIVVDRNTDRIIGILTEAGEFVNPVALAVPIKSLADFVSRVKPFLADSIFPSSKQISPVSNDLYPEFVPPPAEILERRPQEPHAVTSLRINAQRLADSMRNFIAVVNLAWGWDKQEPAAEARYEVRIIDGEQRYREYPSGKKELKETSFLHLLGSVNPVDEWSDLPRLVGIQLRLKIHQAADVVEKGRRMKVFQYYASAEDNLCPFQPYDDYYFFFKAGKVSELACYGEVWTDGDYHILRMSERLDLSKHLKRYKGWRDYQIVLTYGWLREAGETPRLVPLTALIQGRNGKHNFWCRGNYTDYHVFSAHARLVSK
jgi:hypothetical protein